MLNTEPLNTLIYRFVETMINVDSRLKGISDMFGEGSGAVRAGNGRV